MPDSAPDNRKPDSDRRAFLRVMAVGACGMAAFGAGGFAMFQRPDSDGAEVVTPLMPLSKLADIESGKPKRVEVELAQRDAWRLTTRRESLYLLRTAGADHAASFRALSAVCPHAGCEVKPSDDGFGCACHGAEFDKSGGVTKDPAPRDMDELELREVSINGEPWLGVLWQDFRTGIDTKEAL